MVNIVTREFPALAFETLSAQGLPPVLARVFAARGIASFDQLDTTFARMTSYEQLKNIQCIARLLADAIAAKKRLLVVADYDSDGATACAVALRALRQFGATVDYLVPNRFEYGYGLTPEIVRLAASRDIPPDILITVDNGIASVDGVEEAKRLGMRVCITDHHLPGDQIPDAAVIINPNQPGCNFPDKHIAGVGVIFYVMLALRAELRERGTDLNFSIVTTALLPVDPANRWAWNGNGLGWIDFSPADGHVRVPMGVGDLLGYARVHNLTGNDGLIALNCVTAGKIGRAHV